jgi:hypothetical protein
MSKGWQTVGALLIAASYFICLMWSSVSFSLHGKFSFAYGGTLIGGLLTFVAVMVAWFAVRDGQRWSWWTLLFGLITIAVARLAVDRSCSVKIFWQHGCHQFMIGLVLGAIGFVLTRD